MEQKNNTLEKFRKEIDTIDEQIIEMLKQRIGIVKQVKALKDIEITHDFSLYIKPKREFEMIEGMKLIQSEYSPNFFQNIWRTIISASNLVEQNLQFASLNESSKFYTSYYFGNLQNVAIYNVKTAFDKLRKNEIHILGFVSNQDEVYEFLQESENIRIFAGVKIESDYIFFCGKMKNIEKNFNDRAFALTRQKTHIEIAKGVYLKKMDGENSAFNFGYFYEHSCN